MSTFTEFKYKYGGIDGLYAAMLAGTLDFEDIEEVWAKCAGSTFAKWVAVRGLYDAARSAVVRDDVAGGDYILTLILSESVIPAEEDKPAPRVQRLQSVGIQRISDERMRQILQEGWTPEHDDEYEAFEIVKAAVTYASIIEMVSSGQHDLARKVPPLWPWDAARWKPSEDPIRNLEKAGALIAAEIDRLLRLREKETNPQGGEA